MKGVLIGADFLQLENEVKLLEINTDVDILAMDIPFLNLNPLFNYLTNNSFTKLVLIYKKIHIGVDAVNAFQSKCAENNITFEEVIIPNASITIPSFLENENTFYLRCSFDVSAIIDDLYCRDKSEIVNLLMGTTNENIIPKSYVKYTTDNTILDNLTSVVDNGIHPNLIAKKILPDFSKSKYPAFYKITDNTELTTMKSGLDDFLLLQEYKFNSASLSENDNHIFDVARTWNVLLSDVETLIDLGGHMTKNLVPIDYDTITYTGNELDNKWRYMYFSNPMQVAIGVPGEYEVIKYVDGSEVATTLESLQVGDIVKSVKLVGLNANASPFETINWTSSDSSEATMQYSTASVVRKNGITNDSTSDSNNYQSWFSRITYASGSIEQSSLLAPGEQVLVKDSADDMLKFKFVRFIVPGDKIVSSLETEIDVVSNQLEWYTGSLYTVDIEPEDVFVAGTNLNDINANILGSILIHNKWSDVRLKENINKVGISPNGLNIYQFNYLGDNKKYEGVMAQELVGTNFETALNNKNGYYMVDYSKLDVQFKMI